MNVASFNTGTEQAAAPHSVEPQTTAYRHKAAQRLDAANVEAPTVEAEKGVEQKCDASRDEEFAPTLKRLNAPNRSNR